MKGYDFEKFFELSSDLYAVATPDSHFVRVNGAFHRTLGWTVNELLARPFLDFVHPDDVEATIQEVASIKAGAPSVNFGNRYRCADGTYRQLLWTGFLDPESGMLLGVARDATGLVEADQRFRVAIEALPAPVLMVDGRGRVELVNIETERLFGYPSGSLIGRPIESMIPGTLSSAPAARDVSGVFDANGAGDESGAIRGLNAVRSNGRAFPVELRLNPVYFGGRNHWLIVVIDLDARADGPQAELTRKLEDANRKLSRLAITDELTDTLNRRAFDAELRKSLRLFSRLGQALSLIMLDIDHFKLYNDRYGHPAGDEALRAVARLLCQSARDTDVVARYGGEEFAIVLPNTDGASAVQIAERLKARIDRHPWRRERLTVSMGAATIPPGNWGRDPREDPGLQLVREADQALYFSKNHGKDRVTHFAELELPAAN